MYQHCFNCYTTFGNKYVPCLEFGFELPSMKQKRLTECVSEGNCSQSRLTDLRTSTFCGWISAIPTVGKCDTVSNKISLTASSKTNLIETRNILKSRTATQTVIRQKEISYLISIYTTYRSTKCLSANDYFAFMKI